MNFGLYGKYKGEKNSEPTTFGLTDKTSYDTYGNTVGKQEREELTQEGGERGRKTKCERCDLSWTIKPHLFRGHIWQNLTRK